MNNQRTEGTGDRLQRKPGSTRRMQKNGIVATTKRRFKVTTQSKHNQPVAENVLKQNFAATAQNQVWVSDISSVWTREGWLYLTIVLALFSRQIVGWAMSPGGGQDIVVPALKQALLGRQPQPGGIFHADQGVLRTPAGHFQSCPLSSRSFREYERHREWLRSCGCCIIFPHIKNRAGVL